MFLYLPGGNEEQACKEEKTEIYANIIKSFFAMAQMKMKTANFFFVFVSLTFFSTIVWKK